MSSDLSVKHRPKTLNDMHGQEEAVAVLDGWIKTKSIPHVVLLIGPSGCGKTTAARILASHTGVDSNFMSERDCADDRSIDMARDLKNDARYPPLVGKSKVWILDEVVQLPEATQQAMLTLLEEPPAWAYFFLCTTRSSKLLDTFKSRCKKINLHPISVSAIGCYLDSICKAEGHKISPAITRAIADQADGNMREAVALLEKALTGKNPDEQMAAIPGMEGSPEAVQLCRQLMKGTSLSAWPEIAKTLNSLAEPPETVRQIVLAYMSKVLRGGNPRGAQIIRVFQYDFSTTGRAGLDLACWEVISRK